MTFISADKFSKMAYMSIGFSIVFVFLFMGYLAFVWDYFNFKTDAEMSAYFQNHKKLFDKLVANINNEHFESLIYPSKQDAVKAMSEAKLKECQKIMRDLQIQDYIRVEWSGDHASIELPVWVPGVRRFIAAGPTKGYLYSTHMVGLDNLDDLAHRGFLQIIVKDKEGQWYKQLEGDWLIYYDSEG